MHVTFNGNSMLTERDLHVKLTITNKHMAGVTLSVHTYMIYIDFFLHNHETKTAFNHNYKLYSFNYTRKQGTGVV